MTGLPDPKWKGRTWSKYGNLFSNDGKSCAVFLVQTLCMFWIGKYFRIHIKSSFFILDQTAQSYDRKYNLKYSMEKSCIQLALNWFRVLDLSLEWNFYRPDSRSPGSWHYIPIYEFFFYDERGEMTLKFIIVHAKWMKLMYKL